MKHYIYYQDKIHLVDATEDREAYEVIEKLFFALVAVSGIALLAIIF